MKNYKYVITLKGKVIARSQTLEGGKKRYHEILTYLTNPKIIFNRYLKKGEYYDGSLRLLDIRAL